MVRSVRGIGAIGGGLLLFCHVLQKRRRVTTKTQRQTGYLKVRRPFFVALCLCGVSRRDRGKLKRDRWARSSIDALRGPGERPSSV